MTFSPDAGYLVTVDHARPNVVWIWALEKTPRLESALVHEHPVRQIVWHPSRTELLITTVNSAGASVRHWSPSSDPAIIQIPVSRSETGRYEVKWVARNSTFWFGTPEGYVLGYLSDGRFEVLNSINS